MSRFQHLLLLFALWAASATALLFAPSANAQAGTVGQHVPVCVLPATAGMTAAALAADPNRFDCTTPQRAFGPSDYWAASAPVTLRAASDGNLRVRVNSLWQDRITLYLVQADGRIAALSADRQGMSRRLQLGAIIEFPVPATTVPVTRLIWHVEGAANLRGILVGARIATAAESERSNLLLAALYAAFIGLCTALLVYNIALWTALRYRFQLAYCTMLGLLLLYAVSSSGALAWLYPAIDHTRRMTLNYVLLAWAATAAFAFSRMFFERRVFAGWLHALTRSTEILFLAIGMLIALFAPVAIRPLDTIFSGFFMFSFVIVGPILWRAWRRSSNYLWVFALTWAVPIVVMMIRGAQNLGLIGWNFWIENSVVLAMTCEALLTAVAITYRIRLIAIERDSALEQAVTTRRLADTDPLTGLLNRRALLSRAVGRSGEQCLMLIDLDHFKQVNDRIGHDGGDEVLRRFAATLVLHATPGTLVARIGGEEFAMVAPASDAIDPEALLEAVRATVMPVGLPITASVGACIGPLRNDGDWQILYRRADDALFASKAAGRDRVRFALPQAQAA